MNFKRNRSTEQTTTTDYGNDTVNNTIGSSTSRKFMNLKSVRSTLQTTTTDCGNDTVNNTVGSSTSRNL